VLGILQEDQLGFFTSSSAMASEGSPVGENEPVKLSDEVCWLSILLWPLTLLRSKKNAEAARTLERAEPSTEHAPAHSTLECSFGDI